MNKKYIITDKDFEDIKNSIINTDNKLVKLAGIQVEEISQGYIKLNMPLKDVNVNHVGTAYAVSMIMLMEVAGASVIRATYGFNKYIPIIKKIDILYLKPTTQTLICDIRISGKEAIEKITPIEERGKGNYLLPVVLKDSEGEEIARAEFVFYLFPVE